MQTYCLNCKKHANIGPRKLIMTNKVVRQSLKCANCVAEKSRFLKQKSNTKTGGTRLIPTFLYIKDKPL